MARRVALLTAYLAGVLLFFEAASRIALSSPAFFKRVASEDAASWRLKWVERHRKQGRIYFEFDVHSPTRGWALKPGVRDLQVFGDKLLSSNSRGLRGRREYADEKPAGVTRVLVFGDSFTFGEGVSDDETYAHVLEELLPGVEVLNFGVHGYGHDQMLLYLEDEAARYHPDVVILGFLSLDMDRSLVDFRDFAKPRFVLRQGRLELHGVPVPTPEEMIAREAYRPKFGDLLQMLVYRWRWRSGAAQEEMRQLTVAILDEMAARIRGMGARPLYVYLPVFGELTKRDKAMTEPERFFFGYCRERGIQSAYLQSFFLEKLKQGASFQVYGHWGALEHRIAAEGIRAYLLEKGLVKVSDRGPRPGAPALPGAPQPRV
jgi:hypothetical protein